MVFHEAVIFGIRNHFYMLKAPSTRTRTKHFIRYFVSVSLMIFSLDFCHFAIKFLDTYSRLSPLAFVHSCIWSSFICMNILYFSSIANAKHIFSHSYVLSPVRCDSKTLNYPYCSYAYPYSTFSYIY